ncbi:phosphatidate cytidylyltransferase [Brevinema andersonii]|uniref:Phosphatidate cytidylyltransferase n=1 Tax=Brevinema andersonii TaxID=34097 RepID=A0A1I1E4J8_BREAD|nr:phosphatidate cytidylyltransferase [Brevinema andersonii]SFB79793.1 phosphatidate cytidylyltransferase [Brevinema andersonii]
MIKRWLTALIGIPVTLWVIMTDIGNGFPLFITVLLTALLINIEIASMAKNKKHTYSFWLINMIIPIAHVLSYLKAINAINFTQWAVGQIFIFFFLFYATISKNLSNTNNYSAAFETLGFNFIAYTVLIFMLPLFIILKTIAPHAIALILLFTFCWVSDAAGLFTGILFGKHKLTMLPSKNKTLEGFIGSFIINLLLSVLCFYVQGLLSFPFHWSILKWLSFGLLMSFGSNFGDLTESLIKRWTSVKDSGTLLPGMGGLFDTIDSPIFAAPIVWLFFSF